MEAEAQLLELVEVEHAKLRRDALAQGLPEEHLQETEGASQSAHQDDEERGLDQERPYGALVELTGLDEGERLVHALSEEQWNPEKEGGAQQRGGDRRAEMPAVAHCHAAQPPEHTRAVRATPEEVVVRAIPAADATRG